MLFQPFANYNFPDHPGRYLTFSPIITADWQADSGYRWTVPLGGGIGQIMRFAKPGEPPGGRLLQRRAAGLCAAVGSAAADAIPVSEMSVGNKSGRVRTEAADTLRRRSI